MKRVLRNFFTVLALTCVSSAAWALDKDGDVYQISSAADLKAFAQLVNNGENTADAVLTADIVADADQPMIGDDGNRGTNPAGTLAYKGHFNGQNHTITLNWTGDNARSADVSGLFRSLAGNVSNLYIDGEIEVTATGMRTGVLAGRLEGASVITNVTTNVKVKNAVGGDSACSGLISRPSAGNSQIINCLVMGDIVSETASNAGGLVGWNPDNVITEIYNSGVLGIMQVAVSSATTPTDLIGRCSSGNLPIKLNNVHYLLREENTNVERILGGAIAIRKEAVSTEEYATMLKSGEITYALNGDQSEITWYQTLGTDPRPVADPTHGQVYMNGRLHCNGTPYEDATYSNTEGSLTRDEHKFENGVCTICGASDPGFMVIDEEGFYNITNAEQMLWFAAKVNDGSADLKGRIMNPIDFEGVVWTPIGSASVPYAGTFEGGLNKLTNLNGMVFGTTKGATISGIAFESGTITDNADNAHTGSIIGFCQNTNLSNSYSKAILAGGNGDLGGITGKGANSSTIRNTYFAGTFTSGLGTWSMGGIAGSSEGNNSLVIEDCFVYATWEEGLDPGYGARGGIVGWCHSGCDAVNSYCVAPLSDAIGFQTINGDGANGKGNGNGNFATEAEFADGTVAWALNHKTFANAAFYQTVEEDPYPTLDKTRGLVYATVDGYASASDENFDAMRKALIEEARTYANEVTAYVETVNTFEEAINLLSEAQDRDSFIEAYTALSELRALVDESAKAYATYINAAEAMKAKMEETEVAGVWMDLLTDYLTSGEIDPYEDMPNGSFDYIIKNKQLTDEQVIAEIDFMNSIYENALREGYKPGDEITGLMVNANLGNGFNGWTYSKNGSTFTTGGVTDVMPTAESWNATFDMRQTVSNLSDGIYELQVNAAFRAGGDIYSQNYAAWAFANSNETLIMTEGEDAVSQASAIDLENCYINGGNVTDAETGDHISPYDYPYYNSLDNEEDFSYVPYGPLSCSYAFNGGRYVNTIVAQVTEGELTVGLRLPGTGLSADWMGFGNFRLFYRGEIDSDDAAEAFARTLNGDIARATTLLNTQGDTGDHMAHPSYPATLNAALQAAIDAVPAAATGQEKMVLVEQFTSLFQQIYEAKKVYVTMLSTVLVTQNMVAALAETDPVVASMFPAFNDQLEAIAAKWEEGGYSIEEAQSLDDLYNTELYQYIQNSGDAPQFVAGVYQLDSPEDLVWFQQRVNMGMQDLQAEITAPIDLAGTEWKPIGMPDAPFTGTFDGHLYPITNISHMLFGTTDGATINGVALESGSIVVEDATYAAHSGTIIGHASTGAPTTLTNSYSQVSISSPTGSDTGGISGKFYGTITNVYFAGDVDGTNTTGGILGSSSESATPAHLTNCFSFVGSFPGTDRAWYSDGLVGWLHGNCTMDNCYAIAGVGEFGTNYTGGSTVTNCSTKTAEQFASGEVAVLLNGENETPVWFQTLGQDAYPVLKSDHLVVTVDESGNFVNKDGEAIDLTKSDKMPARVNIYDMQGRLLRTGVEPRAGLNSLPAGTYVVGGRKVANK